MERLMPRPKAGLHCGLLQLRSINNLPLLISLRGSELVSARGIQEFRRPTFVERVGAEHLYGSALDRLVEMAFVFAKMFPPGWFNP